MCILNYYNHWSSCIDYWNVNNSNPHAKAVSERFRWICESCNLCKWNYNFHWNSNLICIFSASKIYVLYKYLLVISVCIRFLIHYSTINIDMKVKGTSCIHCLHTPKWCIVLLTQNSNSIYKVELRCWNLLIDFVANYLASIYRLINQFLYLECLFENCESFYWCKIAAKKQQILILNLKKK